MRLLLACLFATWSVGCTAAQPITGVKVWDADFKVIKQLNAAELVEFQQAWSAKTEADIALEKAGGHHFKLDIDKGSTAGARWLYQSTGYVQVLTVKAGKPVYKLQNPEAFNKLIGATK